MANTEYTNAAIDIGGLRLLQAESIEIDFQSNSVDQNTLALGFAGKSPGPKKIMVKVTSAIPTDGFEYDPTPAIQALGATAFAVYMCGTNNRYLKVATGEGTVTQATFKKGTGANASLDFTIEAPFQTWQSL